VTDKPAILIPGYEIGDMIHFGSRTCVFRALRIRDALPVVFKAPTVPIPSVGELGRLRREFTLANAMDHVNVLRYYSMEAFGDSLALALEDFSGVSLKGLIPDHGFSVEMFLKIALQLAEGLDAIHMQKVIHKDIKPSNTLINQETGLVKIIDFGISSQLVQEFRAASSVNRLEGTLAYISPEQTGRMNRPIDYRTDFYSLGVTFYQLLVGNLPFLAEDPLELVHCHLAREVPPIRHIKPEVPAVVVRLVEKLLGKDAETRYQSARGLAADLARCFSELEREGRISDFDLGERDFSEHFQIPRRLYGRAHETRVLAGAFARTARGEREILLVTGYAGIGKSVLVHEVLKPVTAHKGFFISGKFDQLNRNIPYSALTPAFQGLVSQILGEPDTVIRSWREKLQASLGSNASVLVGVLPDLGLILGEKAVSVNSQAADPKNRFRQVFRDFIATFAAQDHPLVLFLDDLQWADMASLELLVLMLSDRSLGHFLLIGAYRDNEVTGNHPLFSTLESLTEKMIPIERIHLKALNAAEVTQLVADTLRCAPDTALPLSEILQEKTHGNPFFSYELLKDLHRRGLLYLEAGAGCWSWKMDQIRRVSVSENVVFFLVERLRQLPQATQDAMKMAACIGNYFDLQLLSRIGKSSAVKTAIDLWPALQEGIVIPLDDSYRLFDNTSESLNMGGLDVSYRFLHDRVQQAAYELIEADHRLTIHKTIGKAMLQPWDEEAHPEKVIDIVHHLNLAESQLDSDEKVKLVGLNLLAGKKAMLSIAYGTAMEYFATAVGMLTEVCWSDSYSQTFELYSAYTEAAYLGGDSQRAEQYSQLLLDKGRTPWEKANIYEMQVVHYTTSNRMEDAIAAGLKGLQLLGVQLDNHPGKLRLLRQNLGIRLSLRGRSIAGLADRPTVTDRSARTVLNLLMRLAIPTYFNDNKMLYASSIMKRVDLALRLGNSPEAAHSYATYGVLLSVMGRYAQSLEFGKLALELNDRFHFPLLRCKLFFLYGFFIHPWHHPIKTMLPLLKKAVDMGIQSGDLIYSINAAVQIPLWIPFADLETVALESERANALLEENPYPYLRAQTILAQQFRFSLNGQNHNPLSMNDDRFNEEEFLATMVREKTITSITIYHLFKMQLCLIFNASDEAYDHLTECDKVISSCAGTPAIVAHCFFSFLILAKNWDSFRGKQRRKVQRRMKKARAQMKGWSTFCEENFSHRALLMEAEWCRIQGEVTQAGSYYQGAIDTAARDGFRLNEAIAFELAGNFYRDLGQDRVASVFYGDSIRLFARWGAMAKVTWFRARLDQSEAITLHEALTTNTTTTFHSAAHLRTTDAETRPSSSVSSEQGHTLDLATVIKSSLAISSEIDYQQLLSKIMEIILECAGAQKGILLLVENDDLYVRATATLKETKAENTHLDKARDLPRKLVRFTFRKGRTVVAHNAAQDEAFDNDSYIHDNEVKSVVCTPIRHKDKISGVLYLENNLVENVFTEDRVELLHLLFAQAAISLENARLLSDARGSEGQVRALNAELADLNADLECRVHERTAELKRARYELLEQAHQAGMADIATSVLHNVGNILNSVITSCQLIQDAVDSSKMDGILKANELLREHIDDLDRFIVHNPKGKNLMRYYLRFDNHYLREKALLGENVSRLAEKVDSIREVIREQQAHATRGFQNEELKLSDVVAEAISVLGKGLTTQQVRVQQSYDDIPMLFLPKNKLLHLLINLLKNARDALKSRRPDEREIRVAVTRFNDHVILKLTDNGEGIPLENQERIFTFGFTTKKNGHGFGLHTCANAMTEMGGSILVESEGKGKGATFTLAFPSAPGQA